MDIAKVNNPIIISIHTPHTRCDLAKILAVTMSILFQSTHLIRGVTRLTSTWIWSLRTFQSTHLIRGVTGDEIDKNAQKQEFQSTHLIRGVTSNFSIILSKKFYFNPHTSYEV